MLMNFEALAFESVPLLLGPIRVTISDRYTGRKRTQ